MRIRCPSIRAALEYGADVVELDVHPTADGEFVVFHDWELDCQTDGTGETRSQTMKYLKTLDIGYGYTADGGKTYPFRGRFVGAMPTLAEVARAFPTTRFLVNLKGSDPSEADRLAAYLRRHSIQPTRLMFYGGERPIERLQGLLPSIKTTTKPAFKRCLTRYLAFGWSGYVPQSCRNRIVFVPINYRHLLWGWPNLFARRLALHNSELFLIGPLTSKTEVSGSTGIDDPSMLSRIPSGYSGGISSDRIDVIGTAVRDRQ